MVTEDEDLAVDTLPRGPLDRQLHRTTLHRLLHKVLASTPWLTRYRPKPLRQRSDRQRLLLLRLLLLTVHPPLQVSTYLLCPSTLPTTLPQPDRQPRPLRLEKLCIPRSCRRSCNTEFTCQIPTTCGPDLSQTSTPLRAFWQKGNHRRRSRLHRSLLYPVPHLLKGLRLVRAHLDPAWQVL